MTPNWTFSVFLSGLALIAQGCRYCNEVGDGPIPPHNEIVMAPNMRITATTPTGVMVITSGNGLKRSYSWEGATRSVEMGSRPSRWYGSLGLAFPGPGNHWASHNGITRGVLEEGQQHFETEAAAIDWIRSRERRFPYVWRNDGLVVGWGKVLGRGQLNVEVWQMVVAGKKPTDFTGGNDDAIVVEEFSPSEVPSEADVTQNSSSRLQ